MVPAGGGLGRLTMDSVGAYGANVCVVVMDGAVGCRSRLGGWNGCVWLDPVVVCLFVLGTLVMAFVDWSLSSFCGECGGLTLVAVRRANLIVSMVVFGVLVVYETDTVGDSGQTWGKRRRRVRVVTRRDGSRRLCRRVGGDILLWPRLSYWPTRLMSRGLTVPK